MGTYERKEGRYWWIFNRISLIHKSIIINFYYHGDYLFEDSLPYGRSVDAEILNLRATIILSFGYAVYYCPSEGLILRLQNTILPFLRQYTANTKVGNIWVGMIICDTFFSGSTDA
jgi:hypothetical protein